MFSSFLWGYKKPRRAFQAITLPKDRGGMALPNCKLYYWAAILKYCISLFDKDAYNEGEIPMPQELILDKESRGVLWRHINDNYLKKK